MAHSLDPSSFGSFSCQGRPASEANCVCFLRTDTHVAVGGSFLPSFGASISGCLLCDAVCQVGHTPHQSTQPVELQAMARAWYALEPRRLGIRIRRYNMYVYVYKVCVYVNVYEYVYAYVNVYMSEKVAGKAPLFSGVNTFIYNLPLRALLPIGPALK